MRVTIAAQAPTHELLVALLKRIVADVSKPEMRGVKERGAEYGYTWEIVPDEKEQ